MDKSHLNSKRKEKCPSCGSRNTAHILYGYPLFDENLKNQLDSGDTVLGGCVINDIVLHGKHVMADPLFLCHDCKKKFGSQPVLIGKDRENAEDYREIVKSICFTVGGYLGGSTTVVITKNEDGAWVDVQKTFIELPYLPENKQIPENEWKRILNKLYGKMYLHEWKKNFVDREFLILDGEYWELNIKLIGNRERNYHGSNAYPSYWGELMRLFSKYAKI